MAAVALQAMGRPIPRETGASRFQDMSHAIYYTNSSVTASTRTRSSVRCHASVSSGVGKSGRRERVRRRVAQVAESLEALERDASLASYDLRLPSTAAFSYESAVSSSSSSSSSESEDDFSYRRRPAAPKVATKAATISVCQGKACQKRGSDRVLSALNEITAGVAGVEVTTCKCLGQCKRAPAVRVDMPTGEQIVYVGVNGADSAVQLASIVLD